MRIVRALYEQDYTEEEMRLLFRAIDWMMALDAEQEIIFMIELEQLEAEKGMPYVTSVERIAMSRGREEGRQEGLASMLMALLAQRFGQVPDWATQKLTGAAPESLERWGKRIFEAQSLEEIFA